MAIIRGGFTVKPHVQALADALEDGLGVESFGTYAGHSPPEGPTQAVDIFTPDNDAGYALQDRICSYLQANVKRFGVRYIIRRHHIWNIERSTEGWRDQGITGDRTTDHYDHVHVTCYATAIPTRMEGKDLTQEEHEWLKLLVQQIPDANRTNDERFATLNGSIDAIKADLAAIKEAMDKR